MVTEQRSFILSQTTLNVLRDCPRCFWRQVVHGVKRPLGPASTLPTKLDRVICSFWNRYAEEGQFPPRLQHRLTGIPALVKLSGWRDPETGLELVGRLDACIQLPTGLFVPVDHKTRGYAPKSVHPAYQLQLDVYSLLLEVNGYTSADYGTLIYYIPKQASLRAGFPFSIEIMDLPTSSANALTVLKQAREVLDHSVPPAPSASCEFCHWVRLFGTIAP